MNCQSFRPARFALFATTLLTLAFFRPTSAAEEPPAATAEKPVRVLVLGSYHFANPGQDLHNVQVDDVRTPEKQAELADVAARLARFQPTKIAVEALSRRPDLAYEKYEAFTPEMLTQNADERVQIGFRLARQLGHKVVFGIDEQSDTVDYFPFDKVQDYAKSHGQGAMLEAFHASVEKVVKELGDAQKTTPVRLMLARGNDAAQVASEHRNFYYALLALGDTAVQPGADLNGGWYLRNAKIFAKLTQVAKPGDRVLVLFGGGHNYWLRHFIRETPGFELVEPGEYLR